jgi:hypothetical protein
MDGIQSFVTIEQGGNIAMGYYGGGGGGQRTCDIPSGDIKLIYIFYNSREPSIRGFIVVMMDGRHIGCGNLEGNEYWQVDIYPAKIMGVYGFADRYVRKLGFKLFYDN